MITILSDNDVQAFFGYPVFPTLDKKTAHQRLDNILADNIGEHTTVNKFDGFQLEPFSKQAPSSSKVI